MTSTDSAEATWMLWLGARRGQVERTGDKPSDEVRGYFRDHTSFGDPWPVTPASCAATACAALEESGLKSPHRADAVSFLKWGTECELKYGAIVVFEFAPGHHHVTFCESTSGPGVTCLGGNQRSKICSAVFNTKYILAVRWPS